MCSHLQLLSACHHHRHCHSHSPSYLLLESRAKYSPNIRRKKHNIPYVKQMFHCMFVTLASVADAVVLVIFRCLCSARRACETMCAQFDETNINRYFVALCSLHVLRCCDQHRPGMLRYKAAINKYT